VVAGRQLTRRKIVGLGVGKLILDDCFLAGAERPAGMVEGAARQGRTNATQRAGYGFTGILVAFLARQNPAGGDYCSPSLLGEFGDRGGLLRAARLPDGSVQVLQGIISSSVLASERARRIGFLKGKS